ncbi:MAG: molecular chaperone DnaJ [Gemmatimonadota bacterium]|nr:molecular chaperone DnaJ [Gemmatimonadota bacterium]
MTTTDKDYYAILGVDPKADAETSKNAYLKLAKQYHPDANPNNPKASERFKDVGEANAVLSDPKKRARYDQVRKLGAFGFGGARPGGTRPGTQQSTSFSFEDLGGLGGFSDIFTSIFDRGKKEEARKPSGPARGENVEYTVEVPFMVAATGGKVPVSVPINEECATCGGTGGAPGTTWKQCEECRGSGTVSFGQGGFAVSRPCPACVGRGRRAEKICGACGGDGKVHQNRKLEVTVPAGVDTGSKVRLTGRGERGTKGGAPGDLIITFKVVPHRFFRREGNDIHVTVPVNLVQAMLGSRIRVSTIAGRKVVLRVPPGTQPGTRFRIRGQGISREGRRGDQFVELKVEVPESLTEEQQEQMREFAESSGMKW